MHLRSSPFMIDGGPRPAGHRFVSDFDGLQPQAQRRLSSLLGSGQLRVNLVVLTVGRPLPVFNKGTFSASVGMSQRCQAQHWTVTPQLNEAANLGDLSFGHFGYKRKDRPSAVSSF